MTQALNDRQFVQYYRQILLPEVGELGQQRLLDHHIIIIGIGGLGTHVAQQLSAVGIGHLYLVDDDSVEKSNLPRQILFDASCIGKLKVNCAGERLRTSNTDISVNTYCERFSFEFAETLLAEHEMLKKAYVNQKLTVLDCTDNMPTRQLINAWCAQKKLRLLVHQ
ncbi:sulfur carrier protein ThiS adenylyltransferase [Glaciecola punicea ACAM 611]|uniref:Sulfur carrier protein ThiS adenylyltransferase n=1 Tax=Glaciecola punicea ACAM 611 TaxID=1121923 RepID=H5TCQ0_9ALTE|nr:sulfur carrier protein ThiS adenylyltransferase [Glaciecola punicea ACAM 611]